jgi:aminoglycoside 6'-N-acetyltransferase
LADQGNGATAPSRPVLAGRTVTLRPGRPGDGGRLRAIMAEPSVSRWWGDPGPAEELEASLRSDGPTVLLVVEIDGEVAGGIQYDEEDDPQYRHAGIDIYLGSRVPGPGRGAEAVVLLAGSLFQARGHHRLTIDPAAERLP